MQRFQNRYRIDSARLPDHDYGTPGWYFVTICTADRTPFFGRVRGGVMGLSPAGCIAARQWQYTPQVRPYVRPYVRLDAFVVMPNHVHGLVGLMPGDDGNGADGNGADGPVETLRRNVSTTTPTPDADENAPLPKNERMAALSPDAGSVPVIIRAYKSIVTRQIRRDVRPDFGWQARFYDRVVRDDAERRRIRRYIQANPQRWTDDRNYPERRPR